VAEIKKEDFHDNVMSSDARRMEAHNTRAIANIGKVLCDIRDSLNGIHQELFERNHPPVVIEHNPNMSQAEMANLRRQIKDFGIEPQPILIPSEQESLFNIRSIIKNEVKMALMSDEDKSRVHYNPNTDEVTMVDKRDDNERSWICKFCGAVLTYTTVPCIKEIANHQNTCSFNPAHKSCPTCKNKSRNEGDINYMCVVKSNKTNYMMFHLEKHHRVGFEINCPAWEPEEANEGEDV